MHWLRRAVGLTIVVLTVTPLYQLLAARDTGLAGRTTVEIVVLQTELLWSGFFLLLILGAVALLLRAGGLVHQVESAIGHLLRRPPLAAIAGLVAAVAFLATALAAFAVFERRPNLVDALLQLLHARYMAAGAWGGPAELGSGFWHLQNAVVTSSGWYSQYPPGHIILLAAGFMMGAEWLVGPALLAGTAALMVLVVPRLLRRDGAVPRAAGALAGLSPVLIAQSAGYMNHSTAALLSAAAVYCALRAGAPGARLWAAGAGFLVAAGTAVRPLAAVVTMVVVLYVWLQPVAETGSAGRPFSRAVRLAVAALAGGLPVLGAHLWYNTIAFGGPATFGYDLAWGPAHGLGFHRDPWGNQYGPIEALLYTAADLAALNVNLLETLLPHVTIAGAYLLLAHRMSPGERVLALWALLPVAANALYWHHGQFMGPRMLAEFTPPWVVLSVVSLHGLVARIPRDYLVAGRWPLRAGASAVVLTAAAAFFLMAPQRVASYGGDWLPSFRTPLPPAPRNSIVFVHSPWETRLVALLAARGIRLDSIETALRQNPTCLVQRHLEALQYDTLPFGAPRPAAHAGLPALNLVPGSSEHLPRLEVARNARIRIDSTVPLRPECLRQVQADRFGALDASFLLWLGDLPGLERGAPLLASDLGPEVNRRLMDRYPERAAWMFGYFDGSDSLRLMAYSAASARLWLEPR